MEKFIAAIDQGTTSTRVILFDRKGGIRASSQKEHCQIFPQPGWVEHDPMEIWNNTRVLLVEAIGKARIIPPQIAAIGVTNQRETTFVWNRKTGKPLHNAIVWQDTRTASICERLGSGNQDRFRRQTGLPLATYFSGPKLTWLLENIVEVQQAADNNDLMFGTADSWLIWNLTGGTNGGIHMTDVSNASRTMLMNLNTLQWDENLLKAFKVPANILPKIIPSSSLFGYTTDPAAGIPVAGDLGDQQAALFGQTCFEQGQAKNTYGTGCFLLMNTGSQPVQSQNGLLTTVGYKIGDETPVYCLEGSIAIAGALVQWLRDNLKIIKESGDIEPLAASVADNGDVYFVPAFSGLFAPYWRSDARGVIAGLTRYANSGHIARAALEATAFQTRVVIEAMERDSNIKLSSLKVDGGMVRNGMLMQFQADQLNVPVICPTITETTALGAAYAAGLAVGYWQDKDDLKENWIKGNEWTPRMSREVAEQYYSRWRKAVERTLNWVE